MHIVLNKGIVIHNARNYIVNRIANLFTIDNPAYVAKKARKLPTWGLDKKLYLFVITGGIIRLGIGCEDKLLEFFKKENITDFTLNDERVYTSDKIIGNFTATLRPYQNEAMSILAEHESGIFESPAGSGKTITGLALAAFRNQRTLWLVHTKELMYQAKEKAEELCPDIGTVGMLYGDNKYVGDGNLIIASIQTLSQNQELLESLSRFIGCVIVDEAHHAPATTFLEVITSLNPKYIYGLTATPFRPDGLQPVMEAALGPIRCTVDRKILYDQGYLIKPIIEFVYTDFRYSQATDTSETDKGLSVNAGGEMYDFQSLLQALYADEERLDLIVKKILKYKDNYQLILGNNKEYLKTIYNLLIESDTFKESEIAIFNSSLTPKARREVMSRWQNKEIKVVLATQIAREGLDILHLNVVHLVTPRKGDQYDKQVTKRGNSLEQEVGRIMRPDPSNPNKISYIVDYVDYETGILKTQHYSRNKVYKRLLLKVPRKPKSSGLDEVSKFLSENTFGNVR